MLISDWSSDSCSSVLAASTGGIPAFTNFLANLDPRITAPILLTQHLPDAFMAFYAKQIATMTERRVRVAAAGMAVEIERAASRERVCKSWSRSVGAGNYRKKISQRTAKAIKKY